jgi:CheY-like chemotaxis protein
MHLEILYVEDNPAEVYLLAAAIRKLDPGLVFTTVGDGEAAIEFLKKAKDHPCVIVLDLGLPKVDGIEVLKAVKCNPELEHVPTIILAEKHGRARVELTGYTPDLFLSKPMDLDGYTKFAEHIVELCNTNALKAAEAVV